MRRMLLLALWLLAVPLPRGPRTNPRPIPPARPQSIRAVIELFTSPGLLELPTGRCAAQDLRRQKDVIVLSLPIDYWDYIGWKDTLASSRNTERQRT